MEVSEITITVEGSTETGKSAIFHEIARALVRSGLSYIVETEGPYEVPDDHSLGKQVDVVSKKVKDGFIKIRLKEVTVSRDPLQYDIPF